MRERTLGMTVVALLNFIIGGLYMLTTVVTLLAGGLLSVLGLMGTGMEQGEEAGRVLTSIGIAALLTAGMTFSIGMMLLTGGYGILRLRYWARGMCLTYAGSAAFLSLMSLLLFDQFLSAILGTIYPFIIGYLFLANERWRQTFIPGLAPSAPKNEFGVEMIEPPSPVLLTAAVGSPLPNPTSPANRYHPSSSFEPATKPTFPNQPQAQSAPDDVTPPPGATVQPASAPDQVAQTPPTQPPPADEPEGNALIPTTLPKEDDEETPPARGASKKYDRYGPSIANKYGPSQTPSGPRHPEKKTPDDGESQSRVA